MKSFIDSLLSNKLTEAKKQLESALQELVEKKLNQLKLKMTAEMYGVQLDEANVMRMGRTKVVRLRIRKGKVQRRKKFSAVKGYTIRGGKLIRMSPQERRNRKLAARRAKFKRRAKLKQALRKRNISLRKRRAMGL
jgi:hypothetical protein